MGMGMKESDITKQILDTLKGCGVWAWKHWSGPMSHVGIADILGIYQGRFLAIEVKGPRGKVSDAQSRFLRNIEEHGGIAFVARSVEDLKLHMPDLPIMF